MPLKATEYAKFRPSMDSQYDALVLPADCKHLYPLTINTSSSVAWWLRWYMGFSDNKYIRIAERYEKWGGLVGLSRKSSYAYHYGDIAKLGDDGLPAYAPGDQVDIRIDNSCSPIHLHYLAPNPHYPNSAVRGLDLEDMDMFTFVKGIFRHRSSKKPLHEILKFQVG